MSKAKQRKNHKKVMQKLKLENIKAGPGTSVFNALPRHRVKQEVKQEPGL